MDCPEIVLVQDTREQNGFGPLFGVPFVPGTLTYGDYSVLGLEHLIAIERKSLSDFLGSTTQSRDRFEVELKRARSMHRFFVIVEAKWDELLEPDFGSASMANPKAMWGTVMAWSHRYHPFIFAGGRAVAAKLTEGILTSYAKEFWKGTEMMRKAKKKSGT